jgi:hypothetical protein
MTFEFLAEAKDCVTLGEAALHLSKVTGQTLTEADILGLALNGHLQLSVFLPQTVADCWDVPEDIPEGNVPDYWADTGQNAVVVSVEAIRGVWDLPLVPPGEIEVRRLNNELRSIPWLPVKATIGTLVERPGIHCRLRTSALTSSAISAVSPENRLVIRTERLEAFAATLMAVEHPSFLLDESLTTKERRSLYIIIAALANAADIPLFNPTKAAGIIIQALADAKYALEISPRNIEDKLKEVVKALDLKKTMP